MGRRYSARPDRSWGPPSLLYNGYRVSLEGRGGRGVGLTPHLHLECRGPRKSRAIPLLTLSAFVAYKESENLPTNYTVKRKAIEYTATCKSNNRLIQIIQRQISIKQRDTLPQPVPSKSFAIHYLPHSPLYSLSY